MNDEILNKLSRVIVDIGLDISRGQNLVINAPIEAANLVRRIAEYAYGNKHVRYVIANYTDENMLPVRIKHSDDEYLSYVPQWEQDYLTERSREDLAQINIGTVNPELSKDLPSDRFNTVNRATIQINKGYRKNFNGGKVNWVSLLYPTKQWAEAVYPELSSADALLRLWDDVIKINRLDEDEPVAAWNEHKERIKRHKDRLDSLDIKKLHFTGPGTDLHVGLVSGGHWAGGAINDGVREFVPNLPTEEVFHLPHKYSVNGSVKSTMPLNYHGNLMEGIEMEFKEGRVCRFKADKGEEILRDILTMDEGAEYLGEVALVPVSSPVYMRGRVYMTTLYDENAVCHIALGNYASCVVEGIEDMTDGEADERGINKSLIHVDFMIGSESVDVYALCKDGKEIQLMNKGQWLI